MKNALSADNLLYALLLFVPVAIVLEYVFHAGAVYVFFTSALGIIPLAGTMGKATESLAERFGAGIGALLNATFGNAAELIIAFMALRAGLYDLVKASITGSIIGNVLLVLGFSLLVGGLKFDVQRFNRTAASLSSTMLVLSAVSLVVPAIFFYTAAGDVRRTEREIGFEIALVLIVTYVLSLVFALKTHAHLYRGFADTPAEGSGWSGIKAAIVLAVATALVALLSEILIGAARETASNLGMTEVFLGVILVAIIGNAAEHSTAVLMARKNQMDVAINIAVGSSIQIALFVAPVLVFLSYVVGPSPMDLRFTNFEVLSVALSVGAMALIALDGESNWMEGVQLLAVYVILGIAFYWL